MTPPDKNHLQIRCPSCSQKFKVGAELMGRMVECGACEQRFQVSEDVLAKGEKFYPGERDKGALSSFQRVPGPTIGVSASTPAVPGPHQEPGYYTPITRVSGFRIAVGWLGALLILGLAVLLPTGSPGPLSVLPVMTKAMVAVVGGAIGVALLGFANPRTWKRTLPIAAVFAAAFLSVPFIFQSQLAPVVTETGEKEVIARKEIDAPASAAEEDIDAIAGLRPLEAEIDKLKASGKSSSAYGVWLREMNDSNRLSVRDYLIRAAGASHGSIIYPREDRNYLMVLTGVSMTIDQLAGVTKKIALQQKLHPELNVIEVKVDSSVFVEGALDKLMDKQSPAFYDLNKRELESVQLERVGRAVRRLADAEPKIYRDDITRQLVSLLTMDQVDFQGDVARALTVWAEDPSVASAAAMLRLKRLHEEERRIPVELITLLSKAKNAEALPIVEGLWLKDATTWEHHFAEFGSMIEPLVIKRLPDLAISMKHSAGRLLGMVGTSASLPALEAAKEKADPEMRVIIENSERSIRERN